jgi:tetrapyrrole methylase family protein / MazG family protein
MFVPLPENILHLKYTLCGTFGTYQKGWDMGSKQDAFTRLMEIIDRLLAPNGCPWDRQQTVHSLAPMVFEEAAEVLDALHEKDQAHLLDELGDLAVAVFFMCKIAQNEERFSWDEPLVKAAQKLIRRHPHIFTSQTDLTPAEVVQQWDELKKEEVFHAQRKSCVDGIPENLPIVAKFQKLCSKISKASPDLYRDLMQMLETPCENEQDELGRKAARLIFESSAKGANLEVALRGVYAKLHKEVVKREANEKVQ